MAKPPRPRTKEIVAEVEGFFGERVMSMSAPGGRGRDSYRVAFEDRTIIVTYRDGSPRGRREAQILQTLSPLCEDIPRFLGYRHDFLYQSDVGERRLSQEIHDLDDGGRTDLAANAVASIFRIQAAARRTSALDTMPHLGATPEWVAAMADGVGALARFLRIDVPAYGRHDICERLAQPAAQFLKWDCRAGNAALNGQGRVSWFDFEYSGRRHGAEDIAFLIGDEVWPVAPGVMFDIVADGFDTATGHARDAYLSYLGLYTTFHAVQRILLILAEVRRRGWSAQLHAVRYDKVGTHPLLGVNVATAAAYCADRHALTRPLVPLFENMSDVFAAAMPKPDAKLAG